MSEGRIDVIVMDVEGTPVRHGIPSREEWTAIDMTILRAGLDWMFTKDGDYIAGAAGFLMAIVPDDGHDSHTRAVMETMVDHRIENIASKRERCGIFPVKPPPETPPRLSEADKAAIRLNSHVSPWELRPLQWNRNPLRFPEADADRETNLAIGTAVAARLIREHLDDQGLSVLTCEDENPYRRMKRCSRILERIRRAELIRPDLDPTGNGIDHAAFQRILDMIENGRDAAQVEIERIARRRSAVTQALLFLFSLASFLNVVMSWVSETGYLQCLYPALHTLAPILAVASLLLLLAGLAVRLCGLAVRWRSRFVRKRKHKRRKSR